MTLHIVDRKTMKIIHSETFNGNVSVGSFDWHDNDHLVINPTGKSKLFEGAMGYGSYFLNIKTKVIEPFWRGETADYGGGEGGSIIRRIGDKRRILHGNLSVRLERSGNAV